MQLHRLACHPLGRAAHVRLDHRCLQRTFALGHPAGDVVGELPPGLDERGHPGELRLAQLVVEHRLAEDPPFLRVRETRLERGLHEAHGARRRLQAAVLEPLHLEIEAAAEPGLAADEVLGGHEPVVEGDLVGVHAPVAERVDGAALDLAPAGLLEREVVPGGGLLLDHEQREARGGRTSGRGRCGRGA